MSTNNSQFPLDSPLALTELIRRARGGCPESRSAAFLRLESYLYETARRYRNRQLSAKEGLSDVVQRSFLKALENFQAFRGETSPEFHRWLRQILINEIRLSHRTWQRRVRQVSRERSLDHIGPSNAVMSSDLPPAAAMAHREQLAKLSQLLGVLPDDYRQVVLLRNFEQLPFVEIASLMNRSSEAVTKLWYRAILKLRSLMAADESSQI